MFKFRRSTTLLSALFSLLGLLSPQSAHGQATYIIPQDVAVNLATGLACTGSAQLFTTGTTPNFDNLGQTQHYISIKFNGSIVTPNQTMINGIDNAGNIYQISDVLMTGAGGEVLTATGYYTKIQISVTCPATATFTLNYSGTSATTNVNSGSNQLAQIDKAMFLGVSSASTQSIPQFQTPFGNAQGTVLFNYIGAGASINLTISCNGVVLSTASYDTVVITPQSNTGIQTFQIPAFGCPVMQVSTSISGTTTFSMEYVFSSPGSAVFVDPCLSPSVKKSSVPINITTATTTQLVAASANAAIYVCGYSFTISQVATTANTLQFEYGTGASCGTGTTALTGLFGAGGVTAAPPLLIQAPSDGTDITAPAGNALCAVTAIGASGSFQGVLTYVQQ